jgi:pantoate--beta-alanine ligase
LVNRVQKYIKKSGNSTEKNSFARLSPSKSVKLHIFQTALELDQWLAEARKTGVRTGFVPTMGALHEGHLSLIQAAKKKCDIVVCSIFVNPTQFNNSSDLLHYPRTPEADINMLQTVQCDAIYLPEITDIYPRFPEQTTFIQLDLNPLDTVMEGAFRPGHFEGVVNVVWRLFDVVKPDCAFFGLKDFQQVAVIKHMVKTLQLPVQIEACPTARETEGLAKSSRNLRLSSDQRKQALIIFETLQLGKTLALQHTPKETREQMMDHFAKGSLQLEYISIVNPETLQPLHANWTAGAVACIAAFCGDVRLIDNLQLID